MIGQLVIDNLNTEFWLVSYLRQILQQLVMVSEAWLWYSDETSFLGQEPSGVLVKIICQKIIWRFIKLPQITKEEEEQPLASQTEETWYKCGS